jgi:branched-chain amino acid transport system permease protein
MALIIDIIMSGLISGSTFALLAIGFSIIFGVARILNLAHTAFYMLAAYCIYIVTQKMGLNPLWGMLAAIVLVTLLGMISYKILLNPIREHEGAVLIATIALAMIFQEVMSLIFTATFLSVPALIMGIDEARVAMVTMGLSVGLASFTGAIVVPLAVLEPHMWGTPLVMMMAVVVLGGLGSLKGSFIGAYILGFAQALVVFLAPMGAFLKGSVALSIMILVLIIRPDGLFGVSFEEER